MFTAIRKVKGLGVFRDFTAAHDLPPLGRFNVVYGENGSGKTTLSRLFRAIEDGEHPEYPDLEFTISTDAGDLTKGQKCTRRLRVFNSDYIDANIGQFDTPIKHILIVGEENKALAEEIKAEQALFDSRTAHAEALRIALEKLEKDKGKVFTAIAATIGEAISGAAERRFRKPDAESAYANLKEFRTLPDAELEAHRATVRQELASDIATMQIPDVQWDQAIQPRQPLELANEIPPVVAALALRSAQAGALKRLSENPDIAKWVEEGRALHQTHSSERCEYCDQAIPAARVALLADHFGIEDQKLKADIERARGAADVVRVAIQHQALPPKAEFYSELRESFEGAAALFESERAKLVEVLKNAAAALDRKLGLRATSYEEKLIVDAGAFSAAFDAVQKLIRQHNRKSAEFEKAKTAARDAIIAHYLSTVSEQIKEFDAQIKCATDERSTTIDGDPGAADLRSLAALESSIRTKKARISSAHAGGERMTNHLTAFLGRTDLRFDSAADGYVVTRRGVRAKRLSEGEKTAIAFLYFIVQLDEDFDITEGIVVIDDPISSLDSSAIYQAFAYLKNAVKSAKQVFLLTHNFDFLKLLLNWIDNARAPKCYLMLVCAESENSRDASIKKLDELLAKHPTEYHYLFKVLYSFKSDGSILASYHIPNIARKLLEAFLEFHVPSNDTIHKKLEAIAFDENKKTAIYKFANDLSHITGKGFDPALVSETQKNSAYLLEMIKTVAPQHYAGLEALAQP